MGQNFVAFSEHLNFKSTAKIRITSVHWSKFYFRLNAQHEIHILN